MKWIFTEQTTIYYNSTTMNSQQPPFNLTLPDFINQRSFNTYFDYSLDKQYNDIHLFNQETNQKIVIVVNKYPSQFNYCVFATQEDGTKNDSDIYFKSKKLKLIQFVEISNFAHELGGNSNEYLHIIISQFILWSCLYRDP